jgi:hypothetical protein
MEKEEVTGYSSSCVTGEVGDGSGCEQVVTRNRAEVRATATGSCEVPKRRARSIQVHWPTNARDAARSLFTL